MGEGRMKFPKGPVWGGNSLWGKGSAELNQGGEIGKKTYTPLEGTAAMGRIRGKTELGGGN